MQTTKKWKLTIGYWHDQSIIETSGIGDDRNEALANFFRQYYAVLGFKSVPEKPLMPSGDDLLSISFVKIGGGK